MRLVGIFLGFAVILVFAGHALAEIPDADPEDFRAFPRVGSMRTNVSSRMK